MLTQKQLEDAIKGKKYPKITEEMMRKRIVDVQYRTVETLTICIIKIDNGYTVTGESACVDPRNYDAKIGCTIAHTKAFEKLWPLFGFLLAEELYRQGKR